MVIIGKKRLGFGSYAACWHLPGWISSQQPQVEIPPVHPLGCMEVAQHSDALARERENYWADEVA